MSCHYVLNDSLTYGTHGIPIYQCYLTKTYDNLNSLSAKVVKRVMPISVKDPLNV